MNTETHPAQAIVTSSTAKRKGCFPPPLLVIVMVFSAIIALAGLVALAFSSSVTSSGTSSVKSDRKWEIPVPEPSGT